MPVYLDHNASAPPAAPAVAAATAWVQSGWGNPSSVHAFGRRGRAIVERARRAVAASIGARPGEIVFTSGATEALHLAISGWVRPGDHVLVSAVEHPAVFGALAVAGAEVEVVPVDAAGRLAPHDFADRARADTRLAVLMAAQNEIGALYPVAAVAEALTVPLLCDATQAYGKIPFSVAAAGAALVTLSGHKVGALPGVGVLWVSPETPLAPVLAGGPQERGRRAGTENGPAIAALGAVAGTIPARIEALGRCAPLRDRLEAGLADHFGDRFVRHGGGPRLPNTAAFRIAGVPGDLLLAALDLEGFCLSSGSACSAGAIEPSPVLRALGLSEAAAREGLRVSIGPETTADDIERLVEIVPKLAARAGRSG